MMPLGVTWHVWRTGHSVRVARVTTPTWDMYARGLLWSCDCGRTWAK